MEEKGQIKTSYALVIAIVVTAIVVGTGTYFVTRPGPGVVTKSKYEALNDEYKDLKSDYDKLKEKEVPSGPVKIGVQYLMSGVASLYGDLGSKGVKMARDEINAEGGILGREIELLIRDEAEDPVANWRELVEAEKVDFLVGVDSSGDALKLEPIVNDELKVPWIVTHAATPRLLSWEKSKYVFRLSASEEPICKAAVKLLAEEFPGIEKIAFMGPDYAYGWDTYETYKGYLEEYYPDAEVMEPLYPALATTDFTSFIDKLKAEKPDILLTNIWGIQLSSFLKQSKETGLWEVIDYHFNNMLTGHWRILPDELVPEKAELWGSGRYTFQWPQESHPLNQRFVEGFRDRYGETPPYVSATGYTALYLIKDVVERAYADLGHWPNSEEVLEYLEGATVAGPMGSVYIRPGDHQGIYPTYWGRAIKGGPKGYEHMILEDIHVWAGPQVYPAPLETVLEPK